jgi:hypothetical protein
MVTLCFIAPAVRRCQYSMAANVIAILTCDVPNVCVSVHLGPTGSTACEIQVFI